MKKLNIKSQIYDPPTSFRNTYHPNRGAWPRRTRSTSKYLPHVGKRQLRRAGNIDK